MSFIHIGSVFSKKYITIEIIHRQLSKRLEKGRVVNEHIKKHDLYMEKYRNTFILSKIQGTSTLSQLQIFVYNFIHNAILTIFS